MATAITRPEHEASLHLNTSTIELHEIAAIPITQAIPPPLLTSALTTAPFIPLSGSLNLRDLGLLPSSPIKKGLLFRSGTLHTIPEASRSSLHTNLGITKIFDLRHDQERAQWPEPEVDGIEQIWLRSDTPPARDDPSVFVADGGIPGFVHMYRGLLKLYAPQYRVILEHLRDHPGEPILWHCTAGKDRAGLFAMLILSLAGAGRETVGFDYSLSRIGVAAGREVLMQNLIKWLGEDAVVRVSALILVMRCCIRQC
jgi:hypothetical protein